MGKLQRMQHSQSEHHAVKIFIKKYGLFIAAKLLLIICVIHAVLLFQAQGLGLDTQKLAFPGETELHLTPGKYTVFYEYTAHKRELDAGLLNMQMGITFTMNSDDVQLDIKPLTHGEQVEIAQDSTSSYTINDRTGNSLYHFRIAEEGSYIISTTNDQMSNINNNELDIALTIIDSFGSGIIKVFKLISFYLIAIILCCAGGLLIYWRGNKRSTILQK